MSPRDHLRTPLTYPLLVAEWACLAFLLVVAVARLFAWDSRASLVALNALSPVLFLPAWAIGVAAAVRRRWAPAATAGVLVVAHLGFGLPEVLASEPLPHGAQSARSFRIFNANVYASNPNVEALSEEIRRVRPDVVVLQESTPPFIAGLEGTGVLTDLPHRVVVSRSDPFAGAVFSRWPLRDEDVVSRRSRPILIRTTIEFPAGPVRVFGFHAVSPVGGLRQEWIEDLDALRAAVDEEEDFPVVIAGDFNATWGHRGFRRLLDSGLTDAAAARGSAFQMTWPRNRRVVPPLLRIDHVLTTERLVVTAIATGIGTGSDHRPLVADVAVI